MKKIFFDIDGVLTKETEGYSEERYINRTPNTKTIGLVNFLFSTEGIEITLYTARFAVDLEITVEWLKKHGVNYHYLIMGKPQYDLLIDDKAIQFQDTTFDLLYKIIRL